MLPSTALKVSAHWLTQISVLNHISALLPDCLRLEDNVTVILPRLATDGVVSAFPDGISAR